jgi:hypothetical protein
VVLLLNVALEHHRVTRKYYGLPITYVYTPKSTNLRMGAGVARMGRLSCPYPNYLISNTPHFNMFSHTFGLHKHKIVFIKDLFIFHGVTGHQWTEDLANLP